MNEASANLSYLWQVPGKPVAVNLTLDVIDRLGSTVEEGLQLLPRRGLETGGVLLGRTRREGDATVVDIEDFEAVECEHAAGPSYLCSQSDRKRLQERIRRHKSASGLSIVGFYRSHTRKNFALTVEDINLMSEFFAKPANVFLLIHVQGGSTPTAGFVIWEGREIRSMTPYLEFPFRTAALRKRGLEIPTPAPTRAKVEPPAPRPAAVAAPAKPVPPPTKVEPPAPRPAAVATQARTLPPPPPAPERPARPQSALSKTFAPIFDQPRQRLQMAAVAAAIFIVAVGLAKVERGMGGVTVPAAAVAQPRLSAAGMVPTPQPVEPPPALPAAPQAEVLAAPVAVAPEAAPAEAKEVPNSRDRVTPRPLREPALPELIPTEPGAEEPEIPEPPVIAGGTAALNPKLSLSSDMLRTPAPIAPGNFVRVTVDAEARRQGIFRKRSAFVPPKPIRQATTEVPPELRNRITHEVPVDVKVYVDRTGKVEFAELLSDSSSIDRQLASLAVFSSRKWQFTPAQSGDENVPAEVVLRFRFGPEK